jgi:cysteine rich repeat protein
MVRSVSLLFAIFLMSGAALAQNQYAQENTAEDRACRSDARRFCKDDIPDQFKVGSCLQLHKDKLTRACKAVIEGHGM